MLPFAAAAASRSWSPSSPASTPPSPTSSTATPSSASARVGARYYGYLSGHTWDAFHSGLGTIFGGFYLLWVAFGLFAAWRIVGLPRVTRRA